MITKGNETILEHCKFGAGNRDKFLIGVNFDGCMDWYTTNKVMPAIKELKEYYGRDWKGTGRTLKYHVYNRVCTYTQKL